MRRSPVGARVLSGWFSQGGILRPIRNWSVGKVAVISVRGSERGEVEVGKAIFATHWGAPPTWIWNKTPPGWRQEIAAAGTNPLGDISRLTIAVRPVDNPMS